MQCRLALFIVLATSLRADIAAAIDQHITLPGYASFAQDATA